MNQVVVKTLYNRIFKAMIAIEESVEAPGCKEKILFEEVSKIVQRVSGTFQSELEPPDWYMAQYSVAFKTLRTIINGSSEENYESIAHRLGADPSLYCNKRHNEALIDRINDPEPQLLIDLRAEFLDYLKRTGIPRGVASNMIVLSSEELADACWQRGIVSNSGIVGHRDDELVAVEGVNHLKTLIESSIYIDELDN